MDTKGKVAIVTGASSGIGRATAILLSQRGAKVVLAARSIDLLEKLSEKLPNSLPVQTDMRNIPSIKKMIKTSLDKFGRIDILVNNAGRGYDVPLEKIDMKMFRELIDLNLIGPIIAMQTVIPIMRKQGEGAIVNISSGTSLMTIPNLSAYSSLKRALNGISLTAAEELAGDKITVSTIYPFITATNFGKNIMSGARISLTQDDDRNLPPADPPEYIAEKILEAIKTGKSEIYAHDWMKNQRGR